MDHPDETPLDETPREVDDGLAFAYGQDSSADSAPSVLHRVREITGRKPEVSLRDADQSSQTPILKPLGPDEARSAGRYVVQGMLGQGGVGTVHRGHDQDLGRDVALKFLHEKYTADPGILHRFVEEAQIGGQLQHPGIVPVYELGMADDRPFFAMKMIKGQTLAKKLAGRTSPADDRRTFLSIFEDICQTMAYAHARGVVHRDLKPANVMIGNFGEVQVVDWGMGKVLQQGGIADEEAAAERQSQLSVIETVRSAGHGTQSVMGSVMGTPAYMPPEQARGDVESMDERSDVFALGAILCEILTGQPPYVGDQEDLIGMAAMSRLDDAHARLAASGAEDAIVELAVECMMPAPAARPASATEVAERVAAYLGAVEERARQAELRATEARYRNRMTLLAAAGAMLLMALGAGAWLWLDAAEREHRDLVMARIATARTAASGALGQATASELDEQLWAAALTGAEQVVALCDDEAVDDSVRTEAEATLLQVQDLQHAAAAEARRLARDEAMQKRLELLRIPNEEEDLALTLDLEGNAITLPRMDEGWQRDEQRRLDTAYAEAFASYLDGLALLDDPIDTVLASLQHGDIEAELATSLDHWALVRDGLADETDAPDAVGTTRIRAVATRLDAEHPWRTKLRSLLPDAAAEGRRLLQLAEEADYATLSPTGCRVLADALWRADEKDAAVAVLRQGQQRYPTDFDLCLRLALALELLPEPLHDEALHTYRIAQALRPKQDEVLNLQGGALMMLGRLDEMERIYRILAKRTPESARWHIMLGGVLTMQDKLDDAIASYKRAIEINPRDPAAHFALAGGLLFHNLDDAIASYRLAIRLAIDNAPYRASPAPLRALLHEGLGNALLQHGKLDEAIASLNDAIELDPNEAKTHTNLGRALSRQGKLDDAIASYNRAIELDPDLAVAHDNLGYALKLQGRLEDAIACYRSAIRIDPNRANAHGNLGTALAEQGSMENAIACFRRVIELDPNDAKAHANLGTALAAQGKADEAIAWLRRAIELDPKVAEAHASLGISLQLQGKLNEALASYRRALEIFGKRGDLASVRSAAIARQQIEQVSQQLERRPALLQVLQRERPPASAAEFAQAVELGYAERRFQDIVAVTEATLATAPTLVGEPWGTYNSACAAALLAAGSASDLPEEERTRLRGLARSWLLREIERWRGQLGGTNRIAARTARQCLRHTAQDPDFDSLRGTAIDSLPEPERAPWRELWATIEAALTSNQR